MSARCEETAVRQTGHSFLVLNDFLMQRPQKRCEHCVMKGSCAGSKQIGHRACFVSSSSLIFSASCLGAPFVAIGQTQTLRRLVCKR
eukprot:518587-Prymnesium_polylepis.1